MERPRSTCFAGVYIECSRKRKDFEIEISEFEYVGSLFLVSLHGQNILLLCIFLDTRNNLNFSYKLFFGDEAVFIPQTCMELFQ